MLGARVQHMQAVLKTEAEALLALEQRLADQQAVLDAVCQCILDQSKLHPPGRLVCTGVGKAGLVARKVSATFASTGTPGFFLHPTEALHGDLGMLSAHDMVLAFSHSGTSDEILALLPSLTHLGLKTIAITGNRQAPLARHADYVIDLGRLSEACPLGLAPSTTTTAMLALGDALALTVLAERQFTSEQYARFHPGGALGRRLMTCAEAMRSGSRVALMSPDTSLHQAMVAIGQARAGSAILVDANGSLLGILTDGDIRRALSSSQSADAVLASPVHQYATMPCLHIAEDALLNVALGLCSQRHINELPVLDREGRVRGLIDIQDLVSRGFETSLAAGAS